MKSATIFLLSRLPMTSDFNPRTHEECDGCHAIKPSPLSHFNPRTHEECDNANWRNQTHTSISIHAPMKSATTHSVNGLTEITDFNPRTHEECDRYISWIDRQSRHFNPRTHEECDRCGNRDFIVGVFQSTHP